MLMTPLNMQAIGSDYGNPEPDTPNTGTFGAEVQNTDYVNYTRLVAGSYL